MQRFEVPEVDYTRYSNRQLAAVPLVVIGLALAVLLGWYLLFGSPVSLGVDFTGGTELRVQTNTPHGEIGGAFTPEPTSIQPVSSEANQYILTFQNDATGQSAANGTGNQTAGLALQARENLEPVGDADVVRSQAQRSATFGASAQQAALVGIVIAFLGMSLIAFILFRTFVPSIAIVISAFGDIVVPLALMNLLGIKLGLGTVAALLMLIGYSVDSDILLNNHILRRSGDFYESTSRAMRTGVTMTLTSIAALAVMAVVAHLFGIGLLASIGLVLVLGLTTDLMNTYMLNLSLLRWYKFEGVAR